MRSGLGERPDAALTLPEPWIDALIALHARAQEDELPLDLSFGPPSPEIAQELLAAGLVAWETPGLSLTGTGHRQLLAICQSRRAVRDGLPWGSVTVTEGPFLGEAGYYDDDEVLLHNADPARLGDYNPGSRAIVYLFSRGEPFRSEPALIPHHHLRAEAHMEQERWVQTNPVRAALVGVPSLSGIERSVSSEAKAALAEWMGSLLDLPACSEE